MGYFLQRYQLVLFFTRVKMACLHLNSNNKNDDSPLNQESVFRYSRQLIMPEIGVKGQLALINGSILIIGAGGLGCPAIQYLVAAGLGRIGIVDYDEAELSNLHRQILHTEERVKKNIHKATSAAIAANELNSSVKVEEFHVQLDCKNALDIISRFDVVIDATDNVPSRYLISDMCVFAKKPLVSGSALRWEGQLTIYNYKSIEDGEYGPCYRCLYPNPPLPETVTNCSDGGVLGVIPGIIGCIQALEAIKIIIGIEPSYHKKLLVFDGLSGTFRNIRLRGRQLNCPTCGDEPSITENSIPDYEKFCGMAASDKCMTLKLLPNEQRMTVFEYKHGFVDVNLPHVLVDVRQPVEIDICSLPNTTNLPIKVLEYFKAQHDKLKQTGSKQPLTTENASLKSLRAAIKDVSTRLNNSTQPLPIVVVCKQGNDSQKAVEILTTLVEFQQPVEIKDIAGGLMSWAANIDSSLHRY